MQLSAIHHVSINISDLDRSLSFWRDLLGLSVLPRPDLPVDGAWLDAGNGQQVHLIVAPVPDDRGQHVAFRIADIDAACSELGDLGIEVRGPFPVGDARQAFFSDPDGNRVELNQPG